jgi:hypothetical protein
VDGEQIHRDDREAAGAVVEDQRVAVSGSRTPRLPRHQA